MYTGFEQLEGETHFWVNHPFKSVVLFHPSHFQNYFFKNNMINVYHLAEQQFQGFDIVVREQKNVSVWADGLPFQTALWFMSHLVH